MVQKSNPHLQRRYNTQAIEAVDKLQAHCQERGIQLVHFVLAWLLNRTGVTSPIIGPRTREQLEDYLAALDLTLEESDHDFVDSVVPPGEHVATFYEAEFGPHLHRW